MATQGSPPPFSDLVFWRIWPPPPPFPLSDLSDKDLSWFERKYSDMLWLRNWVFWSRYNDELRYHHQRRLLLDSNNGDRTMKEKIRCALQGFDPDLFDQPYLIQFWGLVNIGDRRYLTTCDQPFALTHVLGWEEEREGLCRYRGNCLEYLIAVDDTSVREGELGPPGRVFRCGLPEFILDVSDCSSEEYPQRDVAVIYLKTYYGFPVYQSPGHICIGVLEFVLPGYESKEDSICWKECVDWLKMAGLTTICPPILSDWDYIKSSSCHRGEIHEIDNALEEVCEKYQIFVARPWVEANSEEQLLTILEGNQYGQREECFSYTNRFCFIRKGHGVVGKAFSSRSACFCRDIKQLSITEDPFVPNARTFGFSSCFAICLQSSCPNRCIYTLEFFLPTNETNSEDPRTLLRKIMEILEKHLQSSFKLASGEELGQNLVVTVIKVSSYDIFDSFEICRATDGEYTLEIVEVQNQEGMTPPDGSFQQVDFANNSVHDINVQRNIIVESPPALELVQNLLGITHRQPIAELNAAIPRSDDASMEHNDSEAANFKIGGSANYTLESARKITLEDLLQRSAMTLVDAAEDLGVSRSTFKRRCREHKIPRWPPQKARKCNQAIDQQESAQTSKKNSEAHHMSVATRLLDDSNIMVKATYGDDMIKFQLLLSATKMDLEGKVAKRLKLPVGSFKIKFLDEDDEWILVTCDEDLSISLKMLRSLGKNTVRMSVIQ